MKSKSSLKVKILLYLTIFSGLILFFLWFFQILSLDLFYEHETRKTMREVRKELIEAYNNSSNENVYDNLSYIQNVCIEIIRDNYLVYSSEAMNRGCLIESKNQKSIYRSDFQNSNYDKKNYTLINDRLNNKTLVYAVKLDDYTYAYINTSLEPIDSTILILKKQFIYVTFSVLFISLFIAYYLSKRISKPIVAMNKSAKRLARGEYEPFRINSDIEEINELVETLNFASAELSKTDELRKDLMANVSHDLKTPLTMIIAYAEMCRDLNIKDENKIKENLNIIIEESERLNVLVNDILDLSLNESKINNLDIEEFDITQLIKSILKRYDIYKEKEGYNLIFDVNDKFIIRADKQKIEQVIYNLINNAINYTGKDKKIEITLVLVDDNLKVSIKDTGKGIKPEEINDIWRKYYTSNKKHKRNIVGTGLGLSIVKGILDNHKFIYGVESIKRKGTTFYFEINKENIVLIGETRQN